MKPVFIHIGLPKTGTTFLQKKVFNDPFFNFVGTDLKNTRNGAVTQSFLQLVRSVTEKEDAVYAHYREKDTAYAQQIISSQKPTILSNESLSAEWNMADRTSIQKRLKALFPEAKAIVFFRNPFDYLKSHYLQICKGFGVKNYSFSFESFIDDAIQIYERDKSPEVYKAHRNPAIQGLGNIIDRLQYDALAEVCTDVYGKDNIYFFTYESFFHGGDYKRLMELIYGGSEYPKHDFSRRENKAYSEFNYKRSLYAGKKGITYYLKYFYSFLIKTPLKNFSKPIELEFTEEQLLKLHKIFDTSLQRASDITAIDFKALGYFNNK